MPEKDDNSFYRPAEILGTLTDNVEFAHKKLVRGARTNNCPFQEGDCNKLKHNVVTEEEEKVQSFGVCSTYLNGEPLLICEARHEIDKIIAKINPLLEFDNPYTLSEKVLNFQDESGNWKPIGRFDKILADYNENNQELVDFCGIETVSFDTTSTSGINQAVRDFINKGEMKEKYSFGINFAHTYKLMIPQTIVKGRNLERWDKKFVWVIQDVLYEHMVRNLDFEAKDKVEKDDSLFFLLFKLTPKRDSNEMIYEIDDIKSHKNVSEFKNSIDAVKCSRKSLERRIKEGIEEKISDS